MKLLNRLTVRASVQVFVAMACLNAALLGSLNFWQSARYAETTDRLLVDVELARAAGLADMMHDGLRASAYMALFMGPAASDEDKQAVTQEVAEFRQAFTDAVATVAKNAQSHELRAAVAQAQPQVTRYARTAAAIVDAALENPAAGKAALPGFSRDFDDLEKQLGAVSGLIKKQAAESLVKRDAMRQRVLLVTVAAVTLTVSTVAVFGFVFLRTLMQRLGAEPGVLRAFARQIAQGELHTRLDRDLPSEGSVAAAMQGMRDQLRGTVAAIRDGADSVARGSAQIAHGNQQLSLRTERQSSRLQHTAASMEAMTGTVKQTAEHARVASQFAEDASRVAQRGGESVHRVISTMDDIQQASHRISEIIGVIDGIAFQTNILALNAAVEAARAGAQGRGFSVVASEVRGLAQRSATAAREIKKLIDNTVARVDSGHRTVHEAGSTMREIVAGVSRVTQLIGEIRNASSEQDQGLSAVSRSVTSLDSDTQHNAAMVEQTAAAAAALREQAQRLAQAVSAFKLNAA